MGSTTVPKGLTELRRWLEPMAAQSVLVWGDLVADSFLHGTTTRVSREAPALVLRHDSQEYRPGGAGNAAMNAAALGAHVHLAGYMGVDEAGRELSRLLRDAGATTDDVFERRDGGTPTKTRIMAGGVHTVRQQILRIDHERMWPAEPELVEALALRLPDVDALLVSDYGLGTVTPEGLRRLLPIARAHGVPVLLDSRFRILEYPGVTAATPNESEVEQALSVPLDGNGETLERVGRELLERLGSEGLVITRGSAGMAIFRPGVETEHLAIHGTDEIADVTGAGDTVIATCCLALAAGADLPTAARLANIAAGLVVLKHGTATVTRAELDAALAAS